MDYDYQRYEQVIIELLKASWRDPDDLEIGRDISDQPEVKIIFDGYGDLEDTDDIEVVRSVAVSQPSQIMIQPTQMVPQIITQQPYVLVPMNTAQQVPLQVVSSQIPNAPQTLVVDTSPQAMEAALVGSLFGSTE